MRTANPFEPNGLHVRSKTCTMRLCVCVLNISSQQCRIIQPLAPLRSRACAVDMDICVALATAIRAADAAGAPRRTIGEATAARFLGTPRPPPAAPRGQHRRARDRQACHALRACLRTSRVVCERGGSCWRCTSNAMTSAMSSTAPRHIDALAVLEQPAHGADTSSKGCGGPRRLHASTNAL